MNERDRQEFMDLVQRVERLEQHLGIYGLDSDSLPPVDGGTKCPNCFCVYPGGPRLCPNCDHGEVATEMLPPRGQKRDIK
jgi:hypothetical protein